AALHHAAVEGEPLALAGSAAEKAVRAVLSHDLRLSASSLARPSGTRRRPRLAGRHVGGSPAGLTILCIPCRVPQPPGVGVRAARALEHPHLVRALDFGWEGRTPYLVMEFVDGETLGDRIEREGPLPETEAVRIIAQVAEALAAVHGRGLVHRDVKPDNVLL